MVVTYSFKFPLKVGFHARPASMLQEFADLYSSQFTFVNERNGRRANVSSVMALVSSDTKVDDQCVIEVDGRDADVALKALKKFLKDDFATSEDDIAQEPLANLSQEILRVPRVLESEKSVYYRGLPAVKGLALAKAHIVSSLYFNVEEEEGREIDPEVEMSLVENATNEIVGELKERLTVVTNSSEVAIVKAHLSIVQDPSFQDKIGELIKSKGLSAYQAIVDSSEYFSAILQKSDNKYLQERVLDIKDLSYQLLVKIYRVSKGDVSVSLSEPSVLVAKNLPPSMLISMDRKHLKGLILEEGGLTSHTIILARAFGIPCVAGVDNVESTIKEGQRLVLDAKRGLIVPNPNQKIEVFYRREEVKFQKIKERLSRYVDIRAVTKDGRGFEIGANVSVLEELELAFKNGADGVGLFRTEMIFMDLEEPPSEDDQFEIYSRAAKVAEGKPVIIRTLDVGGDKPISYLNLPEEDNPFLGYRAVRVYRDFENIIRSQLKAILRASSHGNLKIMFPMICSVEEVRDLKIIISEIKEEFDGNSVAYNKDIEVGIMIEIPATAFIIDQLSAEVDFFSIGTNDLAQYFLAVDRNNKKVGHLYSSVHPSFLRLLKRIVDEAHHHKKWVGLCGEMGSSEKQLPLLVGLGLDEISVSASFVPQIKSELVKLNFSDSSKVLLEATSKINTGEVDSLLTEFKYNREGSGIITEELVGFDLECNSKEDAIRELVDLVDLSERLTNSDEVEDAIWKREEVYSTGIGFGVAIPHCKTPFVKQNSIAFLKLKKPIEWKSLDNEKVDMVFLLAINSDNYEKDHLKILARLARQLMHEEFRKSLKEAKDASSIVSTLKEAII